MKMKLTKIVYDYTDEGVKVVNHCQGEVEGVTVIYTPLERNDLLYWIRSNGLAIDVVKAIDEVAR